MRFASTTERLGVSLLDAVMTLIAFLPVLLRCPPTSPSSRCSATSPIRSSSPPCSGRRSAPPSSPLVGIKLPGLEFRNQRVEAAYRKELVYGEDDAVPCRPADDSRALRRPAPELLPALLPLHVFQRRADLLPADRQRLRLHRSGAEHRRGRHHPGPDEPDPERPRPGPLLVPVSGQFLDHIVELLSIYKRLRAFEATIRGEELPEIDQEFLAARRREDGPLLAAARRPGLTRRTRRPAGKTA